MRRHHETNLSEGIDVALRRVVSICERDGYEILSANLRLYDKALGEEVAVSITDGEWHEVEGGN